MRSRAPLNFSGHLRFWLQKYLVQNWRELFTVKKSSPLLFLETLPRWKWKMKIWENCNAKGKMTKNKCLSYKIRWLVSPISCWTSPAFRTTLLGRWMNGKFSFLNKVAFQVVCKCLWCLYNKKKIIHGGLCIWDYDSRYLTRERIERGIYRVDNLKRNFRFSQQVNGD